MGLLAGLLVLVVFYNMSCLHTATPTPSFWGFGMAIHMHPVTFFENVFYTCHKVGKFGHSSDTEKVTDMLLKQDVLIGMC